jgi:Protein of unknown function (DUF3987)
MSYDDLRFDIGPPDAKGKRPVASILGVDTVFQDRFDVRESWLRDKYVVATADHLPYDQHAGGYDTVVALVSDRFNEAVNGLGDDGTMMEPWSKPKPLPGLSEVEPFNLDLLPESLRPWIADISERMQCPPDFPAVAAMITIAALIGRKVGIRPKRYDDWLVIPNLWGGPIARPSLLKTPAISEPLKMLRRLEVRAKQEFEQEVTNYAASQLVRKASEKQRHNEIATAAKSGKDPQAVARQWIDEDPKEPTRRRYLISDATVEKVGCILNENPNGVLNFRDEVMGLLRYLDKEGQESARAFYLESWNGDGSFTYDRIGRGTLDIKACCLSILGGVQPGPLADYMRDAVRGGRGDDGLLQRFQLLVWPDVPKDWRNVDRWPETAAKQRAWSVYQKIDAIEAESIKAWPADEDDGVPFLRFDDEAQRIFDAWRADLEVRLRSDEESDAFLAHLGKFRSLVPSLSLVIHLVDNDGGEVGRRSIERAIAWARYLESHARRIYGAVADPQHGSARALAKRILKGDLEDGFTLRAVYQPHWSQLDTRDDAGDAVDVLTTLNWLRPVEIQTGGRPSTTFRINPEILDKRQMGSIKSIKSPVDDAFEPFATVVLGHENHNGHDIDAANRQFDEAEEDSE